MANRVEIKGATISVGDEVSIHCKIKEPASSKDKKEKERIQVFTGIVIAIKGKNLNKTFTVRKIASGGIGVERIWPVSSPWITKVEIKKRGKVRRAKLYYLRKRVGKKATKVKQKIEKTGSANEDDQKEKFRKSGRKLSAKTSSK